MDRSRSPHRDAAPVAGTRPLVNFPVWSGPNIQDNAARGPGLPSNQCPTQSWHQGPRGLQLSQGLPVTQDSQQIPPGQIGPSQHCGGLSQQSGFIPQNRGYQPGYGTTVAPRPHVHGIGLGGMASSFPPAPPTWTSNQFPGQRDLLRPHHQVDRTLEHPILLEEHQWAESQTYLWANTGSLMKSTMTPKSSMD